MRVESINGNTNHQNTSRVKSGASADFGSELKKYINDVNEAQVDADNKIEQLAKGQNANLHETLIAVERAGVSFKLLNQIRNKVVSAYEEMMRMGI